jgi:hypothetical protein
MMILATRNVIQVQPIQVAPAQRGVTLLSRLFLARAAPYLVAPIVQ